MQEWMVDVSFKNVIWRVVLQESHLYITSDVSVKEDYLEFLPEGCLRSCRINHHDF